MDSALTLRGFAMKLLPLILLLASSGLASAEIINVEFKFTPYIGDTKNDEVQAVAGTARLSLNGVPIAEQPVTGQSLPVLFENREIGSSIWLPVASLGPAVRKGKNVLHLEFEPSDPQMAYKAQLRWNSVMEETVEESNGPGQGSATNQTGEGVDEKPARGKVSFDHTFTADFAADQPWHHYPPVKDLDQADRQQLSDLLKARSEAFKPKFEGIFDLLKGKPGVDLNALRKMKCLDAAYQAGIRIPSPQPDELEFTTTGNPEVIVRRKSGNLFTFEPSQFSRIKVEEKQMCAGIVLSAVYPPRLIFVRSPEGHWSLAY
jgi:hypothetical protein